MSITDELREFMAGADGYELWCPRHKNELTAIADRIDAAHKHAIGYVDDRDPETMAENGWVKLPVDVDGVPIRVGDVMEWCDSGDTLTVEGIGKDIVFYIDNEGAEWTAARNKRHHKPTVENVLREFAEKVIDSQIPNVHPTYEEAIAEYAAKLRLAGDAE